MALVAAIAVFVVLIVASRPVVRALRITADCGRDFDAWGRRIHKEGLDTFYRVMHARGEVGPFYAMYLARDRFGLRVCGWWSQERGCVEFRRPSGRLLRRSRSPRQLTERDVQAMREQAKRHADWVRDPVAYFEAQARDRG